jgi:DNA-binding GntR family transcriptional regulator
MGDKGKPKRPPVRVTHATSVRMAIENEIFTGELPPGSPLDEDALAERFSVSRTPIREAMLQLIQSGLIEKRSRQRATVACVDVRRLIHMFETISELEGICARFAARRATPAEKSELADLHAAAGEALKARDEDRYARLGRRFHAVIIEATHNAVLIEITNKLALQTVPYRRFQLRQEGRTQANHSDHERILAAIMAGNALECYEVMRRHVTVQGDVLAEYISMDNSPIADLAPDPDR